jgi:hypothetical protein
LAEHGRLTRPDRRRSTWRRRSRASIALAFRAVDDRRAVRDLVSKLRPRGHRAFLAIGALLIARE